jgi:hypothetical protein
MHDTPFPVISRGNPVKNSVGEKTAAPGLPYVVAVSASMPAPAAGIPDTGILNMPRFGENG